ncbi:hypothetical protein HK102_006504, partial [Quaeritorhiza haematococci]
MSKVNGQGPGAGLQDKAPSTKSGPKEGALATDKKPSTTTTACPSTSPSQAVDELNKKVLELEVYLFYGVRLLSSAAFGALVELTWAAASYFTPQGMAWSSILVGVSILIFATSGVLMPVWFHALRDRA